MPRIRSVLLTVRGFVTSDVRVENSLAERFHPKRNALNAIRLVLASIVFVWHSFAITGTDFADGPIHQLASDFAVDSFFAISGYLIVSSWMRNPSWAVFLRARALRIFPAFWTCLLVTAFVFAPLSVLISTQSVPPGLWGAGVDYILHNGLLRITQYGIDGTLTDVPLPGVWNGSLWTLFWEFLCYLGVLALGVLGLFRFKGILPLAFIAALLGVLATSYGPVHNFYLDRGSMLGIMFIAGGIVYRYQNRIPLRWQYLAIAALVIVASSFLPDYRIVSALPIAYLMVGLGALGTHPRLRFTNDFSYGTYIWAMPAQQILATVGLTSIGVAGFAVATAVTTAPLAVASWFLIERPSLRFKAGRPRRVPIDVAPSSPATVVEPAATPD